MAKKKIIPNSVYKRVEEFNQNLKNAIEETTYEMFMLDNSDGDRDFFKITPMKIDNGKLIYSIQYLTEYKPTEQVVELIDTLDDGYQEFNKKEFNETMRWFNSCMRRGLKDFREFDPEIEEDEEKFEEYMESLE